MIPFEKTHPGIKISIVNIAVPGKLQALLASGNAPDIIRIEGAKQLPSYAIKGIALDLQPYFNKSKNVFNPSNFLPVDNEYRWNGKKQGVGDLYGWPKDWSQDYTLWYNKVLFKKAHIPYLSATKPITWQQLMVIAKKLTIIKNGKVEQYGLGYGGGYTAISQSLIMLPLAQMGKTLWSSNFSQAYFSSPQAMKVEQMWVNAAKGNYGPNPVNNDPNWSGNLFAQNKIAIEIVGYWFSHLLKTKSPSDTHLNDYMMAPAPVWAGGKRMSPTGAATGGIIFSGTKHPQQAWEVFEYLYGGQPAIERAKGGWGIPTLKSLLKYLPQSTPWDKAVFNVQKNELKYSSPFLKYNPYLDLTSVDTELSQYMNPVYFGKSTLLQGATQVDQALNSVIKSSMQAAGN